MVLVLYGLRLVMLRESLVFEATFAMFVGVVTSNFVGMASVVVDVAAVVKIVLVKMTLHKITDPVTETMILHHVVVLRLVIIVVSQAVIIDANMFSVVAMLLAPFLLRTDTLTERILIDNVVVDRLVTVCVVKAMVVVVRPLALLPPLPPLRRSLVFVRWQVWPSTPPESVQVPIKLLLFPCLASSSVEKFAVGLFVNDDDVPVAVAHVDVDEGELLDDDVVSKIEFALEEVSRRWTAMKVHFQTCCQVFIDDK